MKARTQNEEWSGSPGTMLHTVNLSKRFGDTLALEDVNLAVAPGEILCLLGANGAGKTTTINLLLGFTKPTSGSAFVSGLSVLTNARKVRQKLGYVPELVALYPSLSGRENISFFQELAGASQLTPAQLDTMLARLRFPGEALDRRASSYSKGMRQKIGLAIALAKEADTILLDEPLSGLDAASANDLVQVLKEVASRGTCLLISTHDIFRATELATSIGIMRHGRLLELLDPKMLTASELEAVYLRHMAERSA